MRIVRPVIVCLLSIVLVAIAAAAWGAPTGFAVNSRGDSNDPQMINALWRVDLETGESEYIGWTGYIDLEALALDAEGVLFGADDDSKTLLRVSQVTGLALPLGGIGNRFNMGVALDSSMDFGMTFDCEGQGFVLSEIQQTLFRADLEDGRLTPVGEPGSLGVPLTDIAAYGRDIFGIGVGSDSPQSEAAPNLYRVDLETGTTELVGPLGDQVGVYNNAGLAFDEQGRLWAITDRRATEAGDFPSEILLIDTETGAAEKVAETLVGIESLAIAPPAPCSASVRGTPQPLPVPIGGWPVVLLLIAGVGALALRRLRSGLGQATS
ncbi:MAG: hypothetical protein V2J10_12210 [Wenzhouxiangella sp.]|jgi:sugar lactone lactonase YvrE|nr:hypothetical protein [Wenzhouxiangella sp.]